MAQAQRERLDAELLRLLDSRADLAVLSNTELKRLIALQRRRVEETAYRQRSAPSRYMRSLGSALNPLEIAKGVGGAMVHPVETFKQIQAQSLEQEALAEQASQEGRTAEAIGHRMGSFPVLGPAAVEAGEQMASGDVAGGFGTATGLLLPLARLRRRAAQATQLVPERVKTPVATELERRAATKIATKMTPQVGANKQRFGGLAQEAGPQLAADLAASSRAPFSRRGFHDHVGERLAAAEAALDAAADARLAARTFQTGPVIEGLMEKRRALTSEAVEGSQVVPKRVVGIEEGKAVARNEAVPLGSDVVPGPTSERVAMIDQAIAELQTLGPVAHYEAIRRLRQAYDGPARAVYAPAITADFLKAQGSKLGAADVTGVLREHLAKWDPPTATANATYHLYRMADDVLNATDEVERARPKVGRLMMTRLTATVAGGRAAGLQGALTGYILAPALDAMISSDVTLQFKGARLMQRLAGAIRAGDIATAETLAAQLKRLAGTAAIAQGINIEDEWTRP